MWEDRPGPGILDPLLGRVSPAVDGNLLREISEVTGDQGRFLQQSSLIISHLQRLAPQQLGGGYYGPVLLQSLLQRLGGHYQALGRFIANQPPGATGGGRLF